ncbi:FKBP-type peptidyl-prolyl cis-trans isomerase [uncultured Ferrimonas sp.]|uniref:FKBP-type peptidyl-prolyl cis-trans isomerase n=1 Tax=uncultured Ferrimonas sp. TaxID=432640 RepID=UPI00260EF1DB|nr:FKBP-type peptidyl-prolyl cis-trans isomerase [uncultured Ferrimonas sp.]
MKVIIAVVIIVLSLLLLQRSMNNKKTAIKNIELGADFLATNGQREQVTVTATGLQYEVLNAGTGERHPGVKDKVTVHYHGTLIDGTVFDSSVDRGQPASFRLNQVIKGWTEGVQTMVVGQKNRFYVPASLGYGQRGVGSIPAGSVLIFDVELLNVE